MEVESHIHALAVLHCLSTPDALAVFGQAGHVQVAVGFNARFCLAFGEAIGAGNRTARRATGGCRADRGSCAGLIELLGHREMLSQMRQGLRSPAFEVTVITALRIAVEEVDGLAMCL